LVILSGMHKGANVAKWTVSLPPELARFVERYQQTHDLESRSEVIAQGLRSLQAAELEEAYRDHAQTWQNDPEREFWDSAAVDDGLEER
jgi:Arc/MetJ-type ribon-helix-helix transcriptional regulator